MIQPAKNIKIQTRDIYIIGATLLGTSLLILAAVQLQLFFLPLIPVVILSGLILIGLIFREPFFGLLVYISYSFLVGILDREIGGFQYGLGHEMLLVIAWLSVWYNAKRYDFSVLDNSLIWLTVAWFALSVLQFANPVAFSPRAWLQEVRSVALYPLLITPLACLLVNTKKRVDYFLILILALSFLASLNGIKQERIGLSPGEQRFIDEEGSITHLIFGQLRVFSFYSEAGQFGASQAQFCIIALILGIGLTGWFKKTSMLLISAAAFYGMLISGTRGALFALVVGMFTAVIMSKNTRSLIMGGAAALLFVVILKFTYIGNGNYHIYRLRTALDPQDASLNMRLINQTRLAEYLQTKPFGAGLGSIGHWAFVYNPGSYMAYIAPDSYWVKVWAMYGIIGMILFFCMWMYLFGKCFGMIWNMKDKKLRLKLTALSTSGLGIFVCSYGNEVMNAMPSLAVLHASLGIVYVMSIKYKNGLL